VLQLFKKTAYLILPQSIADYSNFSNKSFYRFAVIITSVPFTGIMKVLPVFTEFYLFINFYLPVLMQPYIYK